MYSGNHKKKINTKYAFECAYRDHFLIIVNLFIFGRFSILLRSTDSTYSSHAYWLTIHQNGRWSSLMGIRYQYISIIHINWCLKKIRSSSNASFTLEWRMSNLIACFCQDLTDDLLNSSFHIFPFIILCYRCGWWVS